MKQWHHTVGSLGIVGITKGVEFGALADKILHYVSSLVLTLEAFASLTNYLLKSDSLLPEEIYNWVFLELEPPDKGVFSLFVHSPHPLNAKSHHIP